MKISYCHCFLLDADKIARTEKELLFEYCLLGWHGGTGYGYARIVIMWSRLELFHLTWYYNSSHFYASPPSNCSALLQNQMSREWSWTWHKSLSLNHNMRYYKLIITNEGLKLNHTVSTTLDIWPDRRNWTRADSTLWTRLCSVCSFETSCLLSWYHCAIWVQGLQG